MNSTWREVEPNVFYTDQSPVLATDADLRFLTEKAQGSPLGRARLCAHPTPSDGLHEMLICLTRRCYIRPHRHQKPESALMLSGDCQLVTFDARGGIATVQRLGAAGSGHPFFVRMSESVYHTYLLQSETLLFLETTPGPFNRRLTEYAPWAPAESDPHSDFEEALRDKVHILSGT